MEPPPNEDTAPEPVATPEPLANLQQLVEPDAAIPALEPDTANLEPVPEKAILDNVPADAPNNIDLPAPIRPGEFIRINGNIGDRFEIIPDGIKKIQDQQLVIKGNFSFSFDP
jgi:hypothetical protein